MQKMHRRTASEILSEFQDAYDPLQTCVEHLVALGPTIALTKADCEFINLIAAECESRARLFRFMALPTVGVG
jgi:hypothetical protein